MNGKITTKVSKGVYIVYLFNADGSGVYLTLNQGTGGIDHTKVSPNHESTRNKYLSLIKNEINFNKGILEPNSLRSNSNTEASGGTGKSCDIDEYDIAFHIKSIRESMYSL